MVRLFMKGYEITGELGMFKVDTNLKRTNYVFNRKIIRGRKRPSVQLGRQSFSTFSNARLFQGMCDRLLRQIFLCHQHAQLTADALLIERQPWRFLIFSLRHSPKQRIYTAIILIKIQLSLNIRIKPILGGFSENWLFRFLYVHRSQKLCEV